MSYIATLNPKSVQRWSCQSQKWFGTQIIFEVQNHLKAAKKLTTWMIPDHDCFLGGPGPFCGGHESQVPQVRSLSSTHSPPTDPKKTGLFIMKSSPISVHFNFWWCLLCLGSNYCQQQNNVASITLEHLDYGIRHHQSILAALALNISRELKEASLWPFVQPLLGAIMTKIGLSNGRI